MPRQTGATLLLALCCCLPLLAAAQSSGVQLSSTVMMFNNNEYDQPTLEESPCAAMLKRAASHGSKSVNMVRALVECAIVAFMTVGQLAWPPVGDCAFWTCHSGADATRRRRAPPTTTTTRVRGWRSSTWALLLAPRVIAPLPSRDQALPPIALQTHKTHKTTTTQQVPTTYWIDERFKNETQTCHPDNWAVNSVVDHYCAHWTYEGGCQPWSPAAVANFTRGLSACLTLAFDMFDSVLISPHLDDGTRTGHWCVVLLVLF